MATRNKLRFDCKLECRWPHMCHREITRTEFGPRHVSQHEVTEESAVIGREQAGAVRSNFRSGSEARHAHRHGRVAKRYQLPCAGPAVPREGSR